MNLPAMRAERCGSGAGREQHGISMMGGDDESAISFCSLRTYGRSRRIDELLG
jgi:hypothetical protein